MKEFGISIGTLAVTALITLVGLSGKKIWFLEGPRSAVIFLGIIGMVFCTISVGRFINSNPVHPLTIIGYLVGSLALLTFLTQIFNWNLPIIHDPKMALFVLAGCILVKTVVGRFIHLVK